MKRYSVSERIQVCPAGDLMAIVSGESGAAHVLDHAALELLARIGAATTLDEVVASYSLSSGQLDASSAEIECALDGLVRLGLLVSV